MNKKTLLIIFLCVAVIQIAVPFQMILSREITLDKGKLFRFKTAPVDPFDAFRGRYLALSIEQNVIPLQNNAVFQNGQVVYVHVYEGADGFAKIDWATPLPPSQENDYIEARVKYTNTSSSQVFLQMPFERYYINEKLAPKAEEAYNKANRRGEKNRTYITVYVKSGKAVIDNLYIEDTPIIEYIKKRS